MSNAVRLFRLHEEWAKRSGYFALSWSEFKASRLANPLTARLFA